MEMPVKMPKVSTDDYVLGGGVDYVSPPYKIPPGFCREALNYEVSINGGYKTVDGYERFDGRPAPSEADYHNIPANITGTVSVGDILTGQTSGASGTVIVVGSNFIIVTKATGTPYTDTENLQVAAATQATATDDSSINSAATNKLNWEYKNLAGDEYRSDITAPTGAGPVRGIHRWGGVTYAFRDNVGQTACNLWKSSVSGWTQVTFENEISFTAGNTMTEGETLTQTGTTSVIKRIVTQSGDMSAGTAVGIMVIGTVTSGPYAAGAATTAGGSCTLGGAESAITLSAGGRYFMLRNNFGQGTRIYGVDGVNRAFEFDGTTFAPIPTGMATDTPDHLAIHRNHLFLSFGASLQFSGIADPYAWAPILGAGEINAGDDVTNLIVQPGSAASAALWITTEGTQAVLYGTSSSDFELIPLNEETGGDSFTAQRILGQTFVLDGRGVASVEATDQFGNFAAASISKLVRPFITQHAGKAIESATIRDKNQFRIYYNDDFALYMTVDNQSILGFMPVQLGFSVTCMDTETESAGEQTQWAGGDDGFVYQLDKGTSFDGDPINSFMWLIFNHMGSPRVRKRYRSAAFEIQGEGYSEFQFQIDLGYGLTEINPTATQQTLTTDYLGSGAWDAGTWDTGFWDTSSLIPFGATIEGSAENMSLRIVQSNEAYKPLTFQSVFTQYTARRRERRVS